MLINKLRSLTTKAKSAIEKTPKETPAKAVLPSLEYTPRFDKNRDESGGRKYHHAEFTIFSEQIVAVSDLPEIARTLQSSKLRTEIRHSICAIQIRAVAPGERRSFAIVVTEDMLSTDALDEIHEELSKTYQPATPVVYVATQTVVSELSSQVQAEEESRRAEKQRSPHYTLFVELGKFLHDHGASDIHFKLRFTDDFSPIGFRIDGQVIRPRAYRKAKTDVVRRMLSYMYGFHGNSNTNSDLNVSAAAQTQIEETIAGRKYAFRWAQLPLHKGLKVVMRAMSQDPAKTFTSLGEALNGVGLPPYQEHLMLRSIKVDGGGTLISGKVNSGKSMTMATILNILPQHFEINTAEDPIEYLSQHPGANQHSTSRSLGDTESEDPFASFKMQNKRMDPDASSISELRDEATASAFRDAILAGQPTFSTIHSPNALAIPQRLLSAEFGLSRELITYPGFLKVLMHQALTPRNCPHCALYVTSAETKKALVSASIEHAEDEEIMRLVKEAEAQISAENLQRVERLFRIDVREMRVRNPFGCEHCRRAELPELNGIRGRTLVAQIIEPTEDMLMLVRESRNIELAQWYRAQRIAAFDSDNSDGKSLLEVAMYKVARGEITLFEAEKRFETLDAYEHRLSREGRSKKIVVAAPSLDAVKDAPLPVAPKRKTRAAAPASPTPPTPAKKRVRKPSPKTTDAIQSAAIEASQVAIEQSMIDTAVAYPSGE